MASRKAPTSAAIMENWMLAQFHCSHCDQNHSASLLPCQKYFLERFIIPAHAETGLPTDGTECGICLERLVHSSSPAGDRPVSRTQRVMFLIPCRHFFHNDCILTWHSSIRPERDTCPICRRALFIADPLTQAQLELLQEDDLDDPHSYPEEPELAEEQPGWVMMNGEYMAMDIVASLVVRREFDSLHASGGHFHWYGVCKNIHTVMMTINGPLRPVFDPHKDTFVLLVHSAAALVAIRNSNMLVERVDRLNFINWLGNLLVHMGGELVEELCEEMHQDCLFVTPFQPVVAAPWGYQDQPHMNTFTLRDIVESVMELRQATGLRATLRRVARKLWPRRWT